MAQYSIPLAGEVVSVLCLFLLAQKWKLPRLVSLFGAFSISLVVAVPFVAVTPRLSSGWLPVALFLQILLSILICLGLLFIRFWRDPNRIPPQMEGVILSAADGKVAYVKTLAAGLPFHITKSGRTYLLDELLGLPLFQEDTHLIGVDMNLLDVHVNRSPINGVVDQVHRLDGGFLSLGMKIAQLTNSRLTTSIHNASLKVAVVQVASRLVRRVDGYLHPGEHVSAGQRLGMIRFGSLVVVIFPLRSDVHVVVKPGDQVKAGTSILAYYDESIPISASEMDDGPAFIDKAVNYVI